MRPKILFLLLLCLTFAFAAVSCNNNESEDLPNILFILADDLGYGDLSCLNPQSAWTTTHIDRIAREGMRFTDAHSGSAVCTPTRYGILTGRYSWRSRLKEGVLWSWDPPLISKEKLTVASLLKKQGYGTACIGKWHLGLDWPYHEGTDSIDFSGKIGGGPMELGFDYFFGITASLDIPPYVYIESDHSTTIPVNYTQDTSDYGWWRRGLTGDDFVHKEVLPLLTEKALAFIDRHQEERPQDPFFLYFPLPAPHTPILPTAEFAGKSGTNPYGDFVLQVDHCVGEVLAALDRHGISDQTLLIFTSDNGCSPFANYEELARFGHDPSHIFRGTKADIFEGGHRVPFLVRWPAKVKTNQSSKEVICLTDLMATAADITGSELSPAEGVDSYSLLPALLEESSECLREATVHHSINGSFAIRQDHWKLILCPGSGGWSDPKPASAATDTLPEFQLYNLLEDPGEQVNLVDAYPAIVEEMINLLSSYIKNGRSTAGPSQEYIRTVDWPGLEWMEAVNSDEK